MPKSPLKPTVLAGQLRAGDHVDAHRCIAFVVGPYVKQGAFVSTPCTTMSMFRTIEDILGIKHQNLNDALARPMVDAFDKKRATWSLSTAPSGLLSAHTMLDIPPAACAGVALLYPTHHAAYWAEVTKGMDFSREDQVDGEEFNHIPWRGLKGSQRVQAISVPCKKLVPTAFSECGNFQSGLRFSRRLRDHGLWFRGKRGIARAVCLPIHVFSPQLSQRNANLNKGLLASRRCRCASWPGSARLLIFDYRGAIHTPFTIPSYPCHSTPVQPT